MAPQKTTQTHCLICTNRLANRCAMRFLRVIFAVWVESKGVEGNTESECEKKRRKKKVANAKYYREEN